MNVHEYQAKQLFAEYGLPVSKGIAAETPSEAAGAADIIGGDKWVVKAQVHAGGRGKAGGVKLVKTKDEIKSYVEKKRSEREQFQKSIKELIAKRRLYIAKQNSIQKQAVRLSRRIFYK